MLVIGTGGATTGEYSTQIVFDKSSAIPYLRCRSDGTAVWTGWQKVTVAPISDENMKDIRGNMNVEGALDNVNRMEFKIFAFKNDESQRYRRGVISQQIKKIDKDYVSQVADHLCLDPTPMMLDGLAAIKALRARDEENKKRISKLEWDIEQIKLLSDSLIEKLTTRQAR
ncbi:tail fiber domain-containing protein [Hafnia alvei]|nr:tail fiber domain-containing protein [Hafnia alvei]MBW3474298.1 tail fiber domain-containing protein [Hafnia alvei]